MTRVTNVNLLGASEASRNTAALGLLALCAAHAPLLHVAALSFGSDAWLLTGLSVAVTTLAALDIRVSKVRGRITLALALLAQPAFLLAALAGHKWQVDVHMYFFALLALVAAMRDVRAIVAAAGLVAVHHLAFNAILPDLVYPGGSDLGRTLLHAVILIVETIGIIYLLCVGDRLESAAVAALGQAEALAAEAGQERRLSENALRAVETVLSQAQVSAEALTDEGGSLLGISERFAAQSREQTQSVQSASAAVEEMNASMSSMLSGAGETGRIAAAAASGATECAEIVGETLRVLTAISDHAAMIEEIVKRTDLLALNAAVEAARAGEHGRGFAVVAAEVRNLAERSQTTARQVTTLSAEAADVSRKAKTVLDAMVREITRTAELARSMHVAVGQQRAGADQLADLMRGLAAAAEGTMGDAERLQRSLSRVSAEARALHNIVESDRDAPVGRVALAA